MSRAGSSILIEKPLSEVYEFVADQTKTTSWCLGMTECRLTTDAGIRNGARRHVEVKSEFGRMSWDFELVRSEPNAMLVWQDLEAAVPMIDTYSFEAQGDATVFAHFNEYVKLPLPLKLLTPLLLLKGNRTIKKDNLALKRLLESKYIDRC